VKKKGGPAAKRGRCPRGAAQGPARHAGKERGNEGGSSTGEGSEFETGRVRGKKSIPK